MKARNYLCIAIAVLATSASAQVMSLKECITMGLEHNLQVRSQAQDVSLADVTCTENRNRLLPVIQGFVNLTDNLHRGTSVTDGSGISKLLGMDVPYMKNQGLQYTAQAGVQAQMPLYDPTIRIGIDMADRMRELSRLSLDKAREELTMQIAQLYYLAQTTNEQLRLTERNIRSLEALDTITRALRQEGMVLAVDVKRLNINLANQRTVHDNLQATLEQQLNLLRYAMDLSPDEPLMVEPLASNYSRMNSVQFNGMSSDLLELQVIDKQRQVTERQRRQVKAGYLPSLSLVGQVSWANFTDKFEHYFQDHASNHWYNTTMVGLQLNIPVFDRHTKRNAIHKTDIALDKLALARESAEKQLHTQYLNGLNDWHNNRRTMDTQRENYMLAQEVYDVAANQYREGVTSMSTLLQDEMNVTTAQNAFVASAYKYLMSELTLLKLTSQLDLLSR